MTETSTQRTEGFSCANRPDAGLTGKGLSGVYD